MSRATRSHPGPGAAPTEEAALDAYSQVVSRVAEHVLPSVASLAVRRSARGRSGPSGSPAARAAIRPSDIVVDVGTAEPSWPRTDQSFARRRGVTCRIPTGDSSDSRERSLSPRPG